MPQRFRIFDGWLIRRACASSCSPLHQKSEFGSLVGRIIPIRGAVAQVLSAVVARCVLSERWHIVKSPRKKKSSSGGIDEQRTTLMGVVVARS